MSPAETATKIRGFFSCYLALFAASSPHFPCAAAVVSAWGDAFGSYGPCDRNTQAHTHTHTLMLSLKIWQVPTERDC